MSGETSQQPEHSREGSSQNKSQGDAPMDVTDDEQDEANEMKTRTNFEYFRRSIPYSALKA
jgi:hypothetical protein